MASNANLSDDDILALQPREKRYLVCVGNPKELFLYVNQSGLKTFVLILNRQGKKVHLGEFRKNIFMTTNARVKAVKILSDYYNGVGIENIKAKNKKYLFRNLYENFVAEKSKTLAPDSIKRLQNRHELYTLPLLGNLDAKDIKRTQLREILFKIFTPNEPKTRLETVRKLIKDLKNIFKVPYFDGYITKNPTFELEKDFPTREKLSKMQGRDCHFKAITDENLLREFLIDLKNEDMDYRLKMALYLQILSANRPVNTTEAKWSAIDLKNEIWTIPAIEMKTRQTHKIALCSHAIRLLEKMREFSDGSDFVFSFDGKVIRRDSLSQALRRIKNGKYGGKTTAHGFRSTFKTTCSLNIEKLLTIGVSEKVVEDALSHEENNAVIKSYERMRSDDLKRKKLMQWYGDYINSLCEFPF